MKLAIALAAAGLALTGCASSEPDTRASAGEYVDAPAVTAPATGIDLEALADQIGCFGYFGDADETEIFVAESGSCTMDVHTDTNDVQLRRFGTVEARDNYWIAAREFGLTPEMCATSGLVAVCPDNPDDLAAIRAAGS